MPLYPGTAEVATEARFELDITGRNRRRTSFTASLADLRRRRLLFTGAVLDNLAHAIATAMALPGVTRDEVAIEHKTNTTLVVIVQLNEASPTNPSRSTAAITPSDVTSAVQRPAFLDSLSEASQEQNVTILDVGIPTFTVQLIPAPSPPPPASPPSPPPPTIPAFLPESSASIPHDANATAPSSNDIDSQIAAMLAVCTATSVLVFLIICAGVYLWYRNRARRGGPKVAPPRTAGPGASPMMRPTSRSANDLVIEDIYDEDDDLIGARIVVGGLVQHPDLNGLCGEVCSYNPNSGRYNVKLEGQEEELIALRPLNLRTVPCNLGADADQAEADEQELEAELGSRQAVPPRPAAQTQASMIAWGL